MSTEQEILVLARRLRHLQEDDETNTETYKQGVMILTDLIIEHFGR